MYYPQLLIYFLFALSPNISTLKHLDLRYFLKIRDHASHHTTQQAIVSFLGVP